MQLFVLKFKPVFWNNASDEIISHMGRYRLFRGKKRWKTCSLK